MRLVDASAVIALLVILGANPKPSRAQEISGFSTLSVGRYSTGGSSIAQPANEKDFGRPAVITNSKLEVAAYIDTQEDYTAQMYYDVQSASSVFQGGAQKASNSFQTAVGAPTAAATYLTLWNGNALYTEATNHIVYFFYVASSGRYADPYGFSSTSNDGDYNSGYWFSVYSNLYVVIASIVLGESYDSTNSQVGMYLGPQVVTALYQDFIPLDYANGPTAPLQTNCFPDIYAGDNRTWNPALGSFRAFQQISLGVGGDVSVNPFNAPPAQETGFTYEFSPKVLVNNAIPNTAYNYDYYGKCSALGVNLDGHAPTTGMVSPGVTYVGTSSTSTLFYGSASNPVPLAAFPIQWDVPLTFTEPNVSPAVLNVAGSLSATCFPAHEVSVGTTDVAEWMPLSETSAYIAACLLAGRVPLKTINQNLPLSPIPH